MIGRTLFFKSDADGNITYPINHYFNVGTSKDMLTKVKRSNIITLEIESSGVVIANGD